MASVLCLCAAVPPLCSHIDARGRQGVHLTTWGCYPSSKRALVSTQCRPICNPHSPPISLFVLVFRQKQRLFGSCTFIGLLLCLFALESVRETACQKEDGFRLFECAGYVEHPS